MVTAKIKKTILAKREAGTIQGSRYKVIVGLTRVEIPLMNMDGKIKDIYEGHEQVHLARDYRLLRAKKLELVEGRT